MKFTEEQLDRYSRSLRLRDFDIKDLEALGDTTVAMVGAGGIGSSALRLLASLGFGNIRIIDGDSVELSNMQRQNIYNTRDIGKKKAECASKNLSLMNPEVTYDPVVEAIGQDNAEELLRGSDLIVDGLDSFEARRAVNSASLNLDIPYIFAGAVEYYANLTTFIPGKTGCLNCVMGDAKDDAQNTAAAIGVSPELLSIVGGIEAREALLVATGRQPNLAGKLMAVDIGTLTFDLFEIARSESCPICR
ncbi:MAG: ThiF family adenylyltransferase [Candidatus Hermodarchaeota archaeon]